MNRTITTGMVLKIIQKKIIKINFIFVIIGVKNPKDNFSISSTMKY